MEADWSVALGAEDPVITVPWAAPPEDGRNFRFVDLRQAAYRIDEIAETRARPELRSALLLLNGPESPLWTAKCDAWSSSAEEGAQPLDPYEMDAEPGHTDFGAGSYIDLLPRNAACLADFEWQERWIRITKESLRLMPSKAARVELVLRRAQIEGMPGFGVTWFVEGCGASAHDAATSWGEALAISLTVVMDARH